MSMNPGELWRCCNQDCRAEMVVQAATAEGVNPQCACGSAMKKDYRPPVFRYLEFLRLEEPDRAAARLKD